MASQSPIPITFYDIRMRPPIEQTCSAPNPWKARLALNFKTVPYQTSWVNLPDVPQARRGLNVPPCRQFADGSDFYTLPMMHDHSTDTKVGDSFDIATYIQEKYPESGAGDLFPKQVLDYSCSFEELLVPLSKRAEGGMYDEYARFNSNVDAVFTAHVLLCLRGMPFHPDTVEQTKAEFVRRAGCSSWDDFSCEGQARQDMMESFERELGQLAVLFRRVPEGPFVLGRQPSYADLIVGGWLQQASRCMPTDEWEKVKTWHDGVFGKLWEALQVFAEVK